METAQLRFFLARYGRAGLPFALPKKPILIQHQFLEGKRHEELAFHQSIGRDSNRSHLGAHGRAVICISDKLTQIHCVSDKQVIPTGSHLTILLTALINFVKTNPLKTKATCFFSVWHDHSFSAMRRLNVEDSKVAHLKRIDCLCVWESLGSSDVIGRMISASIRRREWGIHPIV